MSQLFTKFPDELAHKTKNDYIKYIKFKLINGLNELRLFTKKYKIVHPHWEKVFLAWFFGLKYSEYPI